ncbi:MAG: hypothetical protein ACOZNI_36465 [Myxococcota bacterium]
MLAFAGPVFAASVDGGLVARLYPEGVAAAARALEGHDYDVAIDELAARVDCFDKVGVRNFNLHVPLDELNVEVEDGEIHVVARSSEIRGEDMEIFTEDAEWTDDCYETSFHVEYVSLRDARLEMTLAPTIRDGALALDVVAPVKLTGEFEHDVEDFPDDLVAALADDDILKAVGDALGDFLPGELARMFAEEVLALATPTLALDLAAAGVDASNGSLALGTTGSVAWTSECAPGEPAAQGDGRSPALELGDGDGLALAVTERMAEDAARALWEDGFFCVSADDVSAWLAGVQDLFDPEAGLLDVTIGLDAAPALDLTPDGVRLALEGLRVDLGGVVDGEPITVLHVVADADATVALGVDDALGSITAGVASLDLSLRELDAEHLLSKEPGAEQELEAFLVAWAEGWALRSEPFEVTAAAVRAWRFVARVDRFDAQDGALVAYTTVWAEGDPDVDDDAPDTNASVSAGDGDAVRVVMSGRDDRAGPLAYSYRVDDGAWSGWSIAAEATLPATGPGTHRVAVRARDVFHNVDATPVVVAFDGADFTEGGRCGCGGGPVGPFWLAALALFFRQRLRDA